MTATRSTSVIDMIRLDPDLQNMRASLLHCDQTLAKVHDDVEELVKVFRRNLLQEKIAAAGDIVQKKQDLEVAIAARYTEIENEYASLISKHHLVGQVFHQWSVRRETAGDIRWEPTKKRVVVSVFTPEIRKSCRCVDGFVTHSNAQAGDIILRNMKADDSLGVMYIYAPHMLSEEALAKACYYPAGVDPNVEKVRQKIESDLQEKAPSSHE